MRNIRRTRKKRPRHVYNKKSKIRNKKKIMHFLVKIGAVGIFVLVMLCAVLFLYNPSIRQSFEGESKAVVPVINERPEIEVELLTVNEYSRPQIELKEINGIVIHYTANPGATAMQNRDYFEGLKDSKITKASSHFIVGLEGEIVQCIPSSEVAYASNQRNDDTLAIECCHLDESGEFTDETYNALVELTAWLCGEFQVQVDDVIRHYDVTGKNCPKYFVENEEAWDNFKSDVTTYLENHGE